MADPIPPAPKSGSGWRIAFFVLLALNLAALGLVAGAVWRHGGPGGHMGRDFTLGPIGEALTPEDRAALRAEFRRLAPEFREGRRAMRGELQAMLTVLRAEPFDPVAFRQAAEALQNRSAERLSKFGDLIAVRLAAMTAEERAAFADRLERALFRRP